MPKTKPSEDTKKFPELVKDFEKKFEKMSGLEKEADELSFTEKDQKYRPDITRNLSVIFGFFFVFLSAILGFLPYLVSLPESARLICYVLIWMFNLSMFLIGAELFTNLVLLGMGRYGQAGFWTLVIVVMTAYIVFVGELIASNLTFYGYPVTILGYSIFLGLEVLLVIVQNVSIFRITKTTLHLKQITSDYKNIIQEIEKHIQSIIKLMSETNSPEEMEEMIGYCTSVPEWVAKPSFQKEVADAILRFKGHTGIIEEVKRCSKLLENYKIRRALRETAV